MASRERRYNANGRPIAREEDPIASEPQVYLVGAGPGNPGLLTLRAVEVLAQADFVLFDKLVPSRLLEFAPNAERLCVADLAEHHRERHGPAVDSLITAAQAGKRVVRLKGGDPYIFGRGGEEAEALAKADISFEIVPGVTAALGAAAYAGVALTHRSHASAVVLVTGHENPTKPESQLNWQALAQFPGTLVIYMGLSRLPEISELLQQHGKSPDTPCCVVHWATTGDQRTVDGTLESISTHALASGLTSPAIIIIGSVVGLRAQFNWAEHRPLISKRVLVTRPRHQTEDFVHRLDLLGAVPYVLPAVEIRELADWSQVDAAIDQLDSFDWLVFTSSNGVRAFLQRLRHVARDLRALGRIQLAAIGPKTADTLRRFYLEPDLVPQKYQSEDLAQALIERIDAGTRLLLARADRGREVLREQLSKVADVVQVPVYAQVDAVDPNDEVMDCLRRGEIDYVTLTSSNIARALISNMDEACRLRVLNGQVKLVSISPVTSADIRNLGLPVAAEAQQATVEGILETLMRLARDDKG